jgi:hypothetical protein
LNHLLQASKELAKFSGKAAKVAERNRKKYGDSADDTIIQIIIKKLGVPVSEVGLLDFWANKVLEMVKRR